MSAQRRMAIAEIAARYDVCVIEDEVYKPILEERLPSMPELLPDLGFFVTSFTKTVMTGLRTGYLVVPSQYSIRVASILRVTSWSGVNLLGEMASRWIEDGTVNELLELQRAVVMRLAQDPAPLVGRWAGESTSQQRRCGNAFRSVCGWR
jgi:DNA-binding transcriptional MocR family regulator